MQAVTNGQVLRLIEQIGNHYQRNIASPFIRPALLQLSLDQQDWIQIEMLTKKHMQSLGFEIDELYHQIASAARFVSMARRDLLPVLRNRLKKGETADWQKVFRNMAVNNFGSNLRILADLLNELYLALIELDRQSSRGRMPLYMQMPELLDVGRMLVG